VSVGEWESCKRRVVFNVERDVPLEIHVGQIHSPSGTVSKGGERQNMCQPLSQRSHKMILSSWCPPLHFSHTMVRRLSGTLMLLCEEEEGSCKTRKKGRSLV
jgi:hypothetical protein